MIPFIGPSYALATRKADVQRSVNLYPVANEVAGGKTARYLQQIPGLDVFSTDDLALLSINDATHPAANDTDFTLTVTRAGVTTSAVTVNWLATGDLYAALEGYKRAADDYSGTLSFAPGETTKTIVFTLKVISPREFDAVVTLSSPSAGAAITDATGTLTANLQDAFFANVGYLLHFDGTGSPQAFPDVKLNVWSKQTVNPAVDANMAVSAERPKFGAGSLRVVTDLGTTANYTLRANPIGGNYPLGAGNAFTLEGWLYWTGSVDSRVSVGGVNDSIGGLIAEIRMQSANTFLFSTNLSGTDDRPETIPTNQWVHMAMTYDGTTKRWFVGGVLKGSAAIGAGSAKTVGAYRLLNTASAGAPLPAYVDDIRFTFGVCRYTATFTPPAAPFPDS